MRTIVDWISVKLEEDVAILPLTQTMAEVDTMVWSPNLLILRNYGWALGPKLPFLRLPANVISLRSQQSTEYMAKFPDRKLTFWPGADHVSITWTVKDGTQCNIEGGAVHALILDCFNTAPSWTVNNLCKSVFELDTDTVTPYVMSVIISTLITMISGSHPVLVRDNIRQKWRQSTLISVVQADTICRQIVLRSPRIKKKNIDMVGTNRVHKRTMTPRHLIDAWLCKEMKSRRTESASTLICDAIRHLQISKKEVLSRLDALRDRDYIELKEDMWVYVP